MVTRISIILLLNAWLSLQDHSPRQNEKDFSTPRPILTRLYLTRYDFDQPARAQLLARYTAGLRTKLAPEILQAHELMHLMHLFTPSGLHFSALYLWLLPLYWRYKKTQNTKLLIPMLLLSLAPLWLEGYYSLKRVGLLKCAFVIKTMGGLKVSAFSLFLFTFFCDYIWGTYQYSPRSYQLSFLFIGLIFSVLGQPKIFLFAVLMLGQLLVCAITEAPFYPLGYGLGFFYTALFSFLFPLLLMSFWLSPYLPFTPFESLLALLEFILFITSKIAILVPGMNPGAILVSGLFFWLILHQRQKKIAQMILVLSLITDPSPLLSKKIKSKEPTARFKILESRSITQSRWIKSGVSYKNEKGQRCHASLYFGHRWLESCR